MNVIFRSNITALTVVLFASISVAQNSPDADSLPIGSGVRNQSLHSVNISPPKSLLGQKQSSKKEQYLAPECSNVPNSLISLEVISDLERSLACEVYKPDFSLIESDDTAGVDCEHAEIACDGTFEMVDDADGNDDSGGAIDEEEEEEENEDEVKEQEEEVFPLTLLGPRWHKFGPISAAYVSTSQVFNNSRGGINTNAATRYRGNLDLTLTLDTEAANWWKSGQFMVYLQQGHGRTLSKDFVGDAQFYNNFDTSPKRQDLTQLGEYWYKHRFADDSLSVKIGRQDANSDFAYADLGGDFVNSSFLTLANIPMPTWPYQAVGVSSLYQVNDKLRLGGGAYDHGHDIGQWWATTTNRGMFFIGQADYQPFVDIADASLTIVRFGSWYTTSDTLAVDANSDFDNNYGFYTTVDRMLISESVDAAQGLGTFLQYAWAPQDRNQIDVTYGGGLVYRGLLPNRDIDTLGIGFTVVEFSSALFPITGQTSENAIELFYKARLNDWLTVQPDMQYIARPSGIQRDSLVVGLQVEIIL